MWRCFQWLVSHVLIAVTTAKIEPSDLDGVLHALHTHQLLDNMNRESHPEVEYNTFFFFASLILIGHLLPSLHMATATTIHYGRPLSLSTEIADLRPNIFYCVKGQWSFSNQDIV